MNPLMNGNSKSKPSVFLILVLALVVLPAGMVMATTYFNNGAGGNSDWSDNANWTANEPDAADLTYLEDAPSDAVGDLTITLGAGEAANQIFNNSADYNYILDGGDLTTGTSGGWAFDLFCKAGRSMTVNSDLTIPNNSYIRSRAVGAGALTLNGDITVDGAGHLEFRSTATGPVNLNGDNDIGNIELWNATHLVLGHESALGPDGQISVNAAAGNDATIGLVSDVTLDGNIVMASSGNLALRVESGDTDYTLTLDKSTATTDMLYTGGYYLYLDPNGNGDAGNITLKLVAAASGDRRIYNSRFEVRTGTTLEIDCTDGDFELAHSGLGLVASGGMLVKNGANTFNANRAMLHTGGTWINDGTLQLGGTHATYRGNFADSGTITIASGATLACHPTYDDTIGGLAGAGTLDIPTSRTITVDEGIILDDNAAGTLDITDVGDLVLDSGAASVFELGPIGSSDQVAFGSTAGLTLAGSLTIENLGGIEVGTYILFDLNGGSWAGSFAGGLTLPAGVEATVVSFSGDIALSVTKAPQAGSSFGIY